MKDDPNNEQLLKAIIARSGQDAAFRKLLLTNSRKAIEQAAGMPVPATLKVKFVEKDPGVDFMFVLPDLVTEEGELTEEEVAGVAGGTDWGGCQDVSTA
jgi:hypothetical protein